MSPRPVVMTLQLGRAPMEMSLPSRDFAGKPGYNFAGIPDIHHPRIHYAFNLLATEGARVMRCENPKCRRPFVSQKKGRGRFCGQRCSNFFHTVFHRARQEFNGDPKLSKLKGREALHAWQNFVCRKFDIKPGPLSFARRKNEETEE